MRQITISELSELTDLDRRTVQRRVAALQPITKDGRREFYDSGAAIAALFDENSNPQKEKARLDRLRADMVEQQLAISRGELIREDELILAWTKVGVEIKTRLLSIPTKAAPMLIGLKGMPQVKDILEGLIHDALNEIGSPGSGVPGITATAAASDCEPVVKGGLVQKRAPSTNSY